MKTKLVALASIVFALALAAGPAPVTAQIASPNAGNSGGDSTRIDRSIE